ncbi:MAG: PLP-dependent aminotransferase family protein [Oscillospiraceae bacterium]|nr:PLP-dependent aminotransferase family protein [Oscillospiraceae bacterium]
MKYQFSQKIDSLQPSAIREILKATADPSVISFAAGNPAPEAFPVETVQKIAAEILQENPVLALQYSVTEGYTPLRDRLAVHVKERYGIGQDFDQVLVVSGAQQGICLTAHCLVDDGDTIICESPSFIGSLNAFRSFRSQLVGVEMDDDGINIEKLEAALKANPRTKFIYTIPNFQNPTGITMSLEKRKEVYRLALQYGVMILEDNPYGELRIKGEPVPTIKSLDTEGIVIYCGSFSKVLSPGLRVGYVVAPREIVAKLTVAKQCADVHTTILSQLICDKFLAEYDFDAHIKGLQDIYRKKANLMIGEIDKKFNPAVSHTDPEGGLFLWCTLPEGADMMAFCQAAVENHVAVVPGTAFLTDESEPTRSVRLNYSTPTDEQIVKGIDILGGLTYKLF